MINLWRDLPMERPDRIAAVGTAGLRGPRGVSYPDFVDWQREAQVFDGMAAAFTGGTISLGRDGAVPEQFDGLYVSANTFAVLGVKPILGRDFSEADDRPGAEAVVIIGACFFDGSCASGIMCSGLQFFARHCCAPAGLLTNSHS